jgi:hypothetical protein
MVFITAEPALPTISCSPPANDVTTLDDDDGDSDRMTAQPAIVVSSTSAEDFTPGRLVAQQLEHPRDHHMLNNVITPILTYPPGELMTEADAKMRMRRASMCLVETAPPSETVVDPMCDPKNPRKITFEDVSAAFFVIKDNIRETPCTVPCFC